MLSGFRGLVLKITSDSSLYSRSALQASTMNKLDSDNTDKCIPLVFIYNIN